MDGFKKKGIDYTDMAYREAVSKLRYLLAESYTPSTGFSKYSLGHYHPFLPGESNLIIPPSSRPAIVLKKADTEGQPAPELMSFIQRQEDYIEQLEKESQYCRDELSNLMGKVKEVITENEGLHERRKSGMLHSLFDSFEMEEDDDEEDASSDDKVETRTCKKKHFAPSIVFESRISELEAQLTQTKMDLKKAVEDADFLRKKLAEQGMSSSQVTVVPHSDSELYRQIEALQRERDELNEMVNKLNSSVTHMREKEASVSQKLKRSLDAIDQAQFEKNQAEIEVRRLKNELERMNEKQRESMGEQSRRLADVERRFTAQTEQLSTDLSTQWENSTKLTLELEKQRRIETELRRELVQRNSTIDELKKELNTKTTCRVRVATVCQGSLQSEVLASTSERESLQQDVASLRLAVERAERSARQDTARLQAEVTSLRQRLDRADSDLLHARKENLRLTEQIASLEKELHLAKLTNESGENEILRDSKREKELTSMILDMDAKHVQNIADLEGMIQSQTQLVEKLKEECHILTEKLEDTSSRHKETRASLREENEKLVERLASVWESCKELHGLCTQYGLTVPGSQMTEWSEIMISRSMPNSPRRVEIPLTLQDLSLPRLFL